jgi:hypothetical protein
MINIVTEISGSICVNEQDEFIEFKILRQQIPKDPSYPYLVLVKNGDSFMSVGNHMTISTALSMIPFYIKAE